ncbi:MAG: FtsK/SpoIIIE domain-containing protein [Chloroflexi bacterium]|nr:FtsK/SpoIIIE domain-containing protein [Chloroflexota bacterium]
MIDLQRYIPVAQRAQTVISQVLDSRPGTSSEYIQGWVLRGTPQNDVIFYAVLDAGRIPQPEPFARATHQISSALGGQRVYWGNSTGFRIAVVLTPAKRLPRQIELPASLPSGRALIGLRPDGQVASGKWGDLKHIIVVGYTGSGKSVTTRSLVYQAIRQDFNLILADLDGTTFPMLAEHPALLTPLAGTTDEFIEVLRLALGELEHRASLYKRAANFPEKLEEYNQWALANGQEPLKRVLVALDEFNSAVTKTGGPDGKLGKLAVELASRGRKFGMTLLMSAQDFSKEVIGAVRDEVGVIIAHKVNSENVARNVGVAAAAQISERTPGRAITNRWGQIQAFYLDKSYLLANASEADGLTEFERKIAERALRETDGRIVRDVLIGWGLGQQEARRLQEDWKRRGWAENDPQRANGLYVTPKLADLLTNRPAQPTLTNRPPAQPTG